jgi:hypothetical protein
LTQLHRITDPAISSEMCAAPEACSWCCSNTCYAGAPNEIWTVDATNGTRAGNGGALYAQAAGTPLMALGIGAERPGINHWEWVSMSPGGPAGKVALKLAGTHVVVLVKALWRLR